MLHLQRQLRPLRHAASPIFFSLSRALLSTTTSASPTAAFSDYLVTSCGLTREQALKSAKCISHRKSTANPDAVLAFLAGPPLRLSKVDIARVVAYDTSILNCRVDNTLKARVASIRSHGLSDAQLRSLILAAPRVFRTFNVHEKLGFWLPFLGSPDKFLRILRHNHYLLTSDLDRLVRPNIELLRECGLSDCVIAKICLTNSRLFNSKLKTVKSILARAATQLGVPPGSQMFRHAITTACISQEKVDAKIAVLRETLRWSLEEVSLAISKAPRILLASEERLRRNAEFLVKEVGLQPQYIAPRSVMLMYSLERRLVPRHLVVKLLKERRLIEEDQCFYNVLPLTEEKFLEKFVAPFEDCIPGLADAYDSACAGKVPVRAEQ